MSFVARILGRLNGEEPLVYEIQRHNKVPFSGAWLAEQVARARTALAGLQVGPGDRVALLAPNSARWLAADLAILAQGAITVPLYSRQAVEELVVMCRDAGLRALVAATPTLAESIRGAWPESEDRCPILTFGHLFSADRSAAPAHQHGPDEAITIIYTSGTSGEPKGVVLNRANLDFMLPQTAEALASIVGPRSVPDQVFHYLPLCFAGSRVMAWTQLYRGNPLMLSTELEQLVVEMKTADPNYYLNVPAVLERIRRGVGNKLIERGGPILKLYQEGLSAAALKRDGKRLDWKQRAALVAAEKLVFPRIKEQIGPGLEFLICGSAPLAEETQRWFELIGVPVYQVYGLTETTAIVTMDRVGRIEPGKVGYAIDQCETRLDEEGQLLVRGPHIFSHYWNKPEATAAALVEGWFHTGDHATVDEFGNWQIVGRLKNLVIPESGHNVAPEPLEQRLMEIDERIEQAVIIGHGKPFIGVLLTSEAADSELEEALKTLNAELPHYRRLRRFIRTREPFSIENRLLTANSKLRRKVIEDAYRAEIDALYE